MDIPITRRTKAAQRQARANLLPVDATDTERQVTWSVAILGDLRRAISQRRNSLDLSTDEGRHEAMDLAAMYYDMLESERFLRELNGLPSPGDLPMWALDALVSTE